nr:hypothetical protein [uncultured Mediterranean phage uvMED]
MTTMTENEINNALVAGMRERITLREQALANLVKEEKKIHSAMRELNYEIKKIKDFIEER